MTYFNDKKKAHLLLLGIIISKKKEQKMVKSVIFDMDGTLLDSSSAMTYSVNYVRDIMGLGQIDKEFIENQLNQPDGDLPMLLYGTKEYTKEQQNLFRNHYLENSSKFVKPYAGVSELLKYLKSQKISLSIATNAPDIFAKQMLSSCKLDNFFDCIAGANHVEKTKPDPQMLQLICDKLSISIEHSLFIGDSIKDEEAAKNANMPFIFADWGYGNSTSAINRQKDVSKLHSYFMKDLLST